MKMNERSRTEMPEFFSPVAREVSWVSPASRDTVTSTRFYASGASVPDDQQD